MNQPKSLEIQAAAKSTSPDTSIVTARFDMRSEAKPAAQRMAAQLRPRVMLPRCVPTTVTRKAEARGRQVQRRVGRQPGDQGPKEVQQDSQ